MTDQGKKDDGKSTFDSTRKPKTVSNETEEIVIEEEAVEKLYGKEFELKFLKDNTGHNITGELLERAINCIVIMKVALDLEKTTVNTQVKFSEAVDTAFNAVKAYLSVTLPRAEQEKVLENEKRFDLAFRDRVPEGKRFYLFRALLGETICKLADLLLAAKSDPNFKSDPNLIDKLASEKDRSADLEMSIKELSKVYPKSAGSFARQAFMNFIVWICETIKKPELVAENFPNWKAEAAGQKLVGTLNARHSLLKSKPPEEEIKNENSSPKPTTKGTN